MNFVSEIKKDLKNCADKNRAKICASFFKTGKGQYAEGDKFIGVTVPNVRKIALKYSQNFSGDNLPILKDLLYSKIHEERMCALLILVDLYQKNKKDLTKRKIVNFYLDNLKPINNWDLVDLTAYKILGPHMFTDQKIKKRVLNLANANSLWQKRIAIISTFYFIKNQKFSEILFLAKKLMTDKEDLIQKAVGWMLREVGKIDEKILKNFLNKHHQKMPRTMLRCAIEKFPENVRKKYLLKK